MYNSQYYTCEQIDQRLLQGYLDDYNSQNNTNLTKEQFLTLLFNTIGRNSTVDNLVTQIGYYECDTAAGTAAKAITVANYNLFAGGSLKVKFVNKNTANNATLNINSNGAKALYYQGERASSTHSWDAGEVVEIYYDGISYYANNVKGGSGSGVYDVSKEHPTSGPNSDGKFTLEYILNSSNVNELIPVNKREPGMTIQFVQSSDNKYVQYRLMSDTFNTTPANWQGVDITPTAKSNNLIDSGGVYDNIWPINHLMVNEGTIDFSQYSPHNGYISSNKWKDLDSDAHEYIIIDLSEYKDKYIIFIQSGARSSYAYFLEEYNPVEDANATVVRSILDFKGIHISEVPATANYLYLLYTSSHANRMPTELLVCSGNYFKSSASMGIADENTTPVNDGLKRSYISESTGYLSKFKVTIPTTSALSLLYSDGYTWNVFVLKEKPVKEKPDEFPVYHSTKNIESNGVWQREEILKELLLGNAEGSITKYMDFVTAGASTAKNTVDWADPPYPRLFSGFIACNQRKNAKLVIENNSSEPELEILVGCQKGNDNFRVIQNFTDSEYFEIPLNGNYDRVYLLIKKLSGNILPSDFNGIELSVVLNTQENGILHFNPSSEIIPKISNIKRAYRAYSQSPTRDVLTLLHFSDLHNNSDNLERIQLFRNNYGTYINDTINTGDLIDFNSGMPSSYTANSDILNVIGNHEARWKVDGEYVYATQQQLYNLLLAPYIQSWNVIQPSNVGTDYCCYYYKDYSSSMVRLIVLDYQQSDDESTWLTGVLNDAITNGYHVIIATHVPPFEVTKDFQNPFNSIDMNTNSGGTQVKFANNVSQFINNGGHFICWICGHVHDDVMGVGVSGSGFENQLVISIATASVSPSYLSEMQRMDNTKTQDCFNIIGIDTVSKTLKIMRVGANYDRHMRRKNTLSWNYDTNQLIYVD